MPISKVNFQNVAIPPVTDSGGGGGGGGSAGDWNVLTPSDLQTDAQSYSTFTLSSSPVAGYENRITIGATATGTFSQFQISNVGVCFFDTGFSVDDLDSGDKKTAVFQLLWEPSGVVPNSTYTTNLSFPLGVCLFSSLTAPPFTANVNTRGGFYGNGFLHFRDASLNQLVMGRVQTGRMRDMASRAFIGGTIYNYQANEFKGLLHTLTAAQGITGIGNKAICLTQGDFNNFIKNTTHNIDASGEFIGQIGDATSGFSINNTDTVRLGVMFNLFIDASQGGSSPSPNLTWDFNLKWRKLFAGA